jgi:hypothetical protein
MHLTAHLVPLPRRRVGRRGLLRAIGCGVVGTAWLSIAASSAWLVLSTPLLARLTDLGLRDSVTPVAGAVAWAVALTAPACFAVLGIMRIWGAIEGVRVVRGAISPLVRRAALLPPGCTVIPHIRLPEGRRIPDLVVGPHGVAFFEPLPRAATARRTGERWEVRFADRAWRSIENPLVRAARDGDRLRRHLESQEHGFVVRVQPAVLRDQYEVGRSDGCAVVAPDDVPAWLAALPAQRGLSPDRLARVVEILTALA